VSGEKAALYRRIIEGMTSGVAAFRALRDPDTDEVIDFVWILANAYAETVTGRSEAQLIGKRLLEKLPQHGPSGLFDRYRRVVETGGSEEFTTEYHDAGVSGVFAVRVMKLDDGVAVAFTDVSEAERRHREHEIVADRLSVATKAAGIGVWERDLREDANDDGLWDETSRRIWGVNAGAASTRELWLSRMHPDDLADVERALSAAAAADPGGAEASFGRRFRIVRPDGETRHVQSHAKLVRTDRGRRLIGVDWDVTDEVRAARELEVKRQEAEAANLAKSQFLAVMSHEIRTPLNGVLGMAALLAQTELTAAQRRMLDTIGQSGDELLEILNGMLDLSRIEAGRLEIEETSFDRDDLLRRARALFAPQAEEKGLGFRIEVSQGAPAALVGDPTRIRQILYNLISNAVKFTSAGEVVVSVDAHPRAGDAGLDLVFSVRDTGIGVAADKVERIFEPFTQADGSMTRRFGGAGLGLSLAVQLAKILGGDISLQTKEGEGSTFTARVRVEPAIPAQAALGARAPPVGAAADALALHVLAAEDSPTNLLVLRGLLEGWGVEAILVENGLKAIEAWVADLFDVILLDIQMPVMDGVAAAREIRRLEAEAGRPRTPIIAVSANALPHQVEAYLAAGMDEHVPKPIKPADLFAALDRHTTRGGSPLRGAESSSARRARA
jgi:signal transduction histidine kinase/FixJ family two-component response regulator